MTSIWERIQAQKSRETAEATSQQIATSKAKAERLAREVSDQQQTIKKRQQQEQKWRKEIDQILATTGILHAFQEIEKGVPQKTKHAIIIERKSDEYNEDRPYEDTSTTITLAWGKFDLKDGKIVPTRGLFGGNLDYDYVAATITRHGFDNPHAVQFVSITIGRENFSSVSSDWQNDININSLSDSIARHYLHPFHADNKPKPYQPESSGDIWAASGGGGGTGGMGGAG